MDFGEAAGESGRRKMQGSPGWAPQSGQRTRSARVCGSSRASSSPRSRSVRTRRRWRLRTVALPARREAGAVRPGADLVEDPAGHRLVEPGAAVQVRVAVAEEPRIGVEADGGETT